LYTTEPASKIQCSSSRTETSEILNSHFEIAAHSCYVCFCFTLTILFMQTMF